MVVVAIVVVVLLIRSQVVKAELDVGAQVNSSGDLMPVLKMTSYLEAEDGDQSGAFNHFWFSILNFHLEDWGKFLILRTFSSNFGLL